jgi:hypothetical protein
VSPSSRFIEADGLARTNVGTFDAWQAAKIMLAERSRATNEAILWALT